MKHVPLLSHCSSLPLLAQGSQGFERDENDIVDDGDEHAEEHQSADDDEAGVEQLLLGGPDNALHLGLDAVEIGLDAREKAGLCRPAVLALLLGLLTVVVLLCHVYPIRYVWGCVLSPNCNVEL